MRGSSRATMSEMATVSRSSIRSDVIAAYRALTNGDVEPLIAACADHVEWVETIGPGTIQAIEGRSAVATRLDDSVLSARRIALRGIAVDDSAVTFEFADPWWDANRGWLRRTVASAAGVTFKQRVTFDTEIERIVSAQQLALSPFEHDAPNESVSDLSATPVTGLAVALAGARRRSDRGRRD